MNTFLFLRHAKPHVEKPRQLRLFGLTLMFWVIAIPSISMAQTTEPASSPEPDSMKSWNQAKVVSPGALTRMRKAEPVVVPPNMTAQDSLASARVIFVRSTALLVKASTVEGKLRERTEFNQLRLLLTRDEPSADLILELHPDLLTKYVYTAVDPRTGVVVASGKVSSLGGTVAGKVAKRFLKQVSQARTRTGP